MRKFTGEVLVALVAASFATAVIADGKTGAGAGAGVGVGVGAGANVGAGGANVGANVGASGAANGNGQFANEREYGRDRAQTRMSEEGMEHHKAKTAPSHRKGPKAGAEASGSAKESAETRLNSN